MTQSKCSPCRSLSCPSGRTSASGVSCFEYTRLCGAAALIQVCDMIWILSFSQFNRATAIQVAKKNSPQAAVGYPLVARCESNRARRVGR